MPPTSEIFGYCRELDVAPGGALHVMVSTDAPHYEMDLARAWAHGDTERVHHSWEVVPEVEPRRLPGRRQPVAPGSFGICRGIDVGPAASLTAEAFIWPTRLAADGVQGVVHLQAGGSALSIGVEDGHVVVENRHAGEGSRVVSPTPLRERQWWYVAAVLDGASGTVRLHQQPVGSPVPEDRPVTAGSTAVGLPADEPLTLLLAASAVTDGPTGLAATGCFNGKIEAPALLAAALDAAALDGRARAGADRAHPDAVALWDLGADPAGRAFHDLIGSCDGELVGAPTRAVTGHTWDGTALDWRAAPDHYGAVHFHDDDLEDLGWQCDAVLEVPTDLPSGIYAVRLRCDGAEDHIPVFVTPAEGAAVAPVAFLAPTFTYLAYANARLHERVDYKGSGLTDRDVTFGRRDRQLFDHPEFGGSLYDVHSDGSGVCYSSHLRPVLNMRMDFRSAVQDAPRHLAADVLIPSWLHELGITSDVVTDHQLHERGSDLLAGCRVLVTGTHPEYWSAAMLDALEAFLSDGGSVMYLGANGFYWVTASSGDRPHLIEIRRGHAGIRTWESAPGEVHLSQSGEPGGLWRHRGRAPNRLVGIGMTSQGWDAKAPGYRRTEAAAGPRAAFIFEGIPEVDADGAEAVIGDFGLVMGGASGDEIDRADPALGTPPHALVVATSLPHSKYYLLTVEDLPMSSARIGGDVNPLVRSDMVFFEHPGGGAVFSTGSITWVGSLAFDGFRNDVARLTENVLRDFLQRGAAASAASEGPRLRH